MRTEAELAAYAIALGAREVAGWSRAEEALARAAPLLASDRIDAVRKQMKRGGDPLGQSFCALRSAEVRRTMGATYTPPKIVSAMLQWARAECSPVARIVDPGTGSARFLARAGRVFPEATLLGVELDPLAALLARATLATAGFSARARIELCDYRAAPLPPIDGRTLFVGNPPYVRHHLISQEAKTWLVATAAKHGFEASQLAGLHVHFYLATAQKARAGDAGCFITASEWLDVNYGRLVRELFLGPLGGLGISVIEPTAAPFPDAQATAAITCFTVGARPRSIRLRRVATLDELHPLHSGRPVRRERLAAASRWTPLTRGGRKAPEGFVELGELCRVHRGQVTGANKIWIADSHSDDLPSSVLFPTVTKARELIQAAPVLSDANALRRVIDLPTDLSVFDGSERRAIDRFLRRARSLGAHQGYIAKARKAWWSVGLRNPAPILSTYMARRPPAFVLNAADARHINIAHGIYPREPLPENTLQALVRFLGSNITLADGRTYAGGLTKFEPRELERLLVPTPAVLLAQPSVPALPA